MLTPEQCEQVKVGDTVAWKRTARHATRSWGLVDWITPEGPQVHAGAMARNGWRGVVPWERITQHWSGRAEFDRHAR